MKIKLGIIKLNYSQTIKKISSIKGEIKLDNNIKESQNEKIKIAPNFKNDQLGENAMDEFAEDYDNKSSNINKNNKK